MPEFNVEPQKELPSKRRPEPETNQKEAKDLAYTDSSSRVIKNEPADQHQIGSSVVRRNEYDDED